MTCGTALLLVAAFFAFPLRVAEAQTVSFTPVGSIAGPADLVEVNGGHAYVSSGKMLTIVDITDPAAPKPEGAYAFPELIWGFTVVGSTVYVAADTYGLGILDVSNPSVPVLRGWVKTPGQAKGVTLFGTKALVADHVSGIDVIDLSRPGGPALAGSFFVDGFAKDVVTSGTLAFALDQPGGLYVFDMAKTGSFEPSATLALARPIPLRAQLVVSPELGNSPRLALVIGGGPVQVYDVSNPQAMVHATTYRTPGVAQRVSLKGTRAYVADGSAGLQVLDLSTATSPMVIGSFKTTAPARAVAVAEHLVYVIVGAEVLILRQTD